MVLLVLEPQDDAKGWSFADVIDAAAPLKKNWVLVGVGRPVACGKIQSKEMRFVWYRCCLSCFGFSGVFEVFWCFFACLVLHLNHDFNLQGLFNHTTAASGANENDQGLKVFSHSVLGKVWVQVVDLDLIEILSLRSKHVNDCLVLKLFVKT